MNILVLNGSPRPDGNTSAMIEAIAEAFAGRREKIITQMHFGAVYNGGKYG